MRPGAIALWVEHLDPRPVEIARARRDGELVGLAPLIVGRLGGRGSTTGVDTAAYEPPVTSEEAAAALCEAILADRPNQVLLEYIERSGPVCTVFSRLLEQAGYRVTTAAVRRSPYVAIEGEWESYLAGLGGTTRRELGKRRRRLEKAGELRLDVRTGAEGLDADLAEGIRLEGAAWKREAGTSIDSDPQRLRYITELSRWAAARGILRLAFLRVDGTPVAFNLCLEEAGVHYICKTGYDPEWARHSPGQLITFLMIERCFRLGLDRYEFIGASERWKDSLATGWHELVLLQALGSGPLGRVRRLQHALARRRTD